MSHNIPNIAPRSRIQPRTHIKKCEWIAAHDNDTYNAFINPDAEAPLAAFIVSRSHGVVQLFCVPNPGCKDEMLTTLKQNGLGISVSYQFDTLAHELNDIGITVRTSDHAPRSVKEAAIPEHMQVLLMHRRPIDERVMTTAIAQTHARFATLLEIIEHTSLISDKPEIRDAMKKELSLFKPLQCLVPETSGPQPWHR